MTKKRTYWTKMNLDEAREAIEVMDDGEVGRWFKAWIIGAGGKEKRLGFFHHEQNQSDDEVVR